MWGLQERAGQVRGASQDSNSKVKALRREHSQGAARWPVWLELQEGEAEPGRSPSWSVKAAVRGGV